MWFIDSEKFVSFLFWKKNDKILSFDIVYLSDFDKSPSKKRGTSQFQNLVTAEGTYYSKCGIWKEMLL